MRSVVLMTVVALAWATACGGSQPTGGGHSLGGRCSDQAERLTFSGKLEGSFVCSGSRVLCAKTSFGKGYTAHLTGDVGKRGVVMDITVGGSPGHDYHGAASYATGPEQSEPAAGVRLVAGGGSGADWRSEGGNPVVVTADDPHSLSGTLDLQLIGLGQTVHVSGTWACDKP